MCHRWLIRPGWQWLHDRRCDLVEFWRKVRDENGNDCHTPVTVKEGERSGRHRRQVRLTITAQDHPSEFARDDNVGGPPFPFTHQSNCVTAAGAGAVRRAVAGGEGPRPSLPSVLRPSRVHQEPEPRGSRAAPSRPTNRRPAHTPSPCHGVRAAGSGAACGDGEAQSRAPPPPSGTRARYEGGALTPLPSAPAVPPLTPVREEGHGNRSARAPDQGSHLLRSGKRE